MDIISYRPYFDPEIESLIERIHPPRVCIDNEACQDCTVVKVDSANKHGILLDMVQVLTDLDLVISKSYISSDGGWFMDVFHVTDQLGNKLTDGSLIIHMQQALCASRASGISNKSPSHASTNHTALEMTGMDQPGMMSEMVAVLEELGCHVTGAVAWAHKSRVACIIYLEDGFKGGPITDPARLAQVQDQLENVVEAHHEKGGRRCVRLIAHCPSPSSGKTHTERRLHQLMHADGDYEQFSGCDYTECRRPRGCVKTHVLVEICSQKGYSIVNVRSRDRPKLLFDTVCALTEMQYVVFHAAVGSHGPIADQEYFIRRKDGRSLISESERVSLTQCLIGAIERRVSQGLRLEVCAKDRTGLLSDVTRVFRENGLSILGVEMGRRGENMIGSFNVIDSSGNDANLVTLEVVRKEIGGSVLVVNKASSSSSSSANNLSNSSAGRLSSTAGRRNSSSDDVEERTKFSLGSLLWSHLERLSGNFSPIRS